MSGFWTSETMKARLPDLITPFQESRVVNCSYELSLGSEVYVTGEQAETKRLLSIAEQVRIPSGQFANLLTEESVKIPPDALGLISIKFRLKQRGLVNVSGFHVDPGYSGKLLFSVYNAGPKPVIVSRNDPSFLLWYCTLEAPTADVYDRPERSSITSEDVMHLQGEIASPQALATRVQAIERRMDVWTWVMRTIVAAIMAAIISIGVGILDLGGDWRLEPTSAHIVNDEHLDLVAVHVGLLPAGKGRR